MANSIFSLTEHKVARMRVAIRQSQTGAKAATSGYTLVELLVVLSVISLLIAATPAIISAARPSADTTSAAYILAEELRAARSAAIVNDADRTLVLDLATKAYVVIP